MADRATSQARQQVPTDDCPVAEQDASTTTLRRAGHETDDSDDEDGDDNLRPTKRCLRSDGPAEESLPLRPQRLTLQRRGQATDEERQAAAELRAQKALNSTIRKKIRCLERRQVLQAPSAERSAMRDYHMTWEATAEMLPSILKPIVWSLTASPEHMYVPYIWQSVQMLFAGSQSRAQSAWTLWRQGKIMTLCPASNAFWHCKQLDKHTE